MASKAEILAEAITDAVMACLEVRAAQENDRGPPDFLEAAEHRHAAQEKLAKALEGCMVADTTAAPHSWPDHSHSSVDKLNEQ